MRYQISRGLLVRTFELFRRCGQGRRECQVVWTSPWSSPETITQAVHPKHQSSAFGFALDSKWLNEFWIDLAQRDHGVRVQVHTHPGAAFHSETDDAYPLIHQAGFLSLVIPNFGLGPIGFESAYLAELGSDGQWREISCKQLRIT